MRGHSRHGNLDLGPLLRWKVDIGQLLLLWDHPHIHILLVRSSYLLLLLLKKLDLLLQSKLFHYKRASQYNLKFGISS